MHPVTWLYHNARYKKHKVRESTCHPHFHGLDHGLSLLTVERKECTVHETMSLGKLRSGRQETRKQMAKHSRTVVSQEFPPNKHADTERRDKGRLKYAPSNRLSFFSFEAGENDHDLSENAAFVTYVTPPYHQKNSNRNKEIRKKIGDHNREGFSQAMLQQTADCTTHQANRWTLPPWVKEPIEMKLLYSSAANRLAGKRRLNERHAKTRINMQPLLLR